MAVTSGFFNSQNGDRKYSAEQMSALFDALITDGVFANIGTAFEVKILSGTSSDTITVGIGRCWFNSTWLYNDALLPIAIEPSEMILDRIDAVIIEINKNEDIRSGQIRMIKGVPSANPENPELVKSNNVYQYPLAYIYRSANSPTITQAAITNMIGTSACPYVTGILEVQTIDKIVAQWESEFNTWFDQIKTVLDGDVAANLANKVLEIEAQLDMLAKERTLTRELESSKSLALQDNNGVALMGATVFASPASSGETITIQTSGASDVDEVFKVGDTLTTVRTDLGDNWALCNGDVLKRDAYTELSSNFPYYPIGNWKTITISEYEDQVVDVIGAAYGNGYYVILTRETSLALEAYCTTDLLNGNWTRCWNGSLNSTILWSFNNDIQFLNGQFVISGNIGSGRYDTNNVLYVASNPTSTWNKITLGGEEDDAFQSIRVSYVNGMYLAMVVMHNNRRYSTNILYTTDINGSWTTKQLSIGDYDEDYGYVPESLTPILYVNGKYVIGVSISEYIYIYHSATPNGEWTKTLVKKYGTESSNIDEKITNIIHNGKYFIIVGFLGEILYSEKIEGPWNTLTMNGSLVRISNMIYDRGAYSISTFNESIYFSSDFKTNLWEKGIKTACVNDILRGGSKLCLANDYFITNAGQYNTGSLQVLHREEMALPEISSSNGAYTYMKIRSV